MDDFVVALLAQELVDLLGLAALDPVDLPGRVVGEADGEGAAFRVHQLHRGALAEAAEDLDDAGGQQAFVAWHQGRPGPLVHQDGALGVDVVGQPVLAALEFLGLGQEQGAHLFAGKDFVQDAGGEAVGDEGGEAGGRGLFGGLELAAHAAPAQGPGPGPRPFRARRRRSPPGAPAWRRGVPGGPDRRGRRCR